MKPLHLGNPQYLQDSVYAGRTRIVSLNRKGVVLTPIDEILAFVSEDRYTTVKTKHGDEIIGDSLSSLELEFGDRFLRVNRNALAGIQYIRRIEREPKHHGGTMYIDGLSEGLWISQRQIGGVFKFVRAL